MRFAKFVFMLFATAVAVPASAQQTGPLGLVDTCIFNVPTTATSLGVLCGYNPSTDLNTKCTTGFTLVSWGGNGDTDVICLGGANVNTTLTTGGKCFPICKDLATCRGKVEQPVRGSVWANYVVATANTYRAYVICGKAP